VIGLGDGGMSGDPYNKIAKKYDRYVEPSIAALRQIGMKMYKPKEGMHVLDVGCGTGTNLMLYHEAGCNVFGIDLSPAMVEMAQEKLGNRAEIRLGDASKMPYSDNSFDLITGFFILHEMPDRIRPAVISEMARVVKHGGRILLIDYHLGPIRFPKGWMFKVIILFFEIMAGREHFRNYRDFLARNCLQNLIFTKNLRILNEKIVGGGNVALFLLKTEYRYPTKYFESPILCKFDK
jgi:demethylmenaquinone methyltransferase/2-methoxy-6-polyprenyl-1,4-benzoquinol methylase